MMDETLNDPLKELEAALDVMPSPEFAAKVRMNVVAANTGGRSSFRWWALVSSGVAAAIVGAIVWPRQVVAPMPTAASVPAVEIRPSAADVTPEAPTVLPGRARTIPSIAEIDRTEPTAIQYGNVLVPRDQAIALDALLAGVRTGTSVVPAQPDPLVELPAWKNVQISPVQIEPLPDLSNTEGDEE